MARKRILFGLFELAELLDDFLGESHVAIRDKVVDVDHGPDVSQNQHVSRLFAEYVFERHEEGEVKSPLDLVVDFNSLLFMARKYEPYSSFQTAEGWRTVREIDEEFPGMFTWDEIKEARAFLSGCDKARIDGAVSAEASRQADERIKTRRAEASAVISAPRLRSLVMERDGAKCKWCGKTEGLALDHITPVVAGGTDDIENLQVLCGNCNSSKGDRVPSRVKEDI